MVEETELVAFLPAPGAHIVAISEDVAAKREGQREDVFRNRIEGIVADVRDDDAMRLAVGFVDDIRAGGGDRDQFKIGKLRQRRFAHRHLVDDGDCRILQAIDDLVRPRSPHIPYSYAENPASADWPRGSNGRERRSSVARRDLSLIRFAARFSGIRAISASILPADGRFAGIRAYRSAARLFRRRGVVRHSRLAFRQSRAARQRRVHVRSTRGAAQGLSR